MSTRVDPNFSKKLEGYGKADWSECFHCGNCSAICPLTENGFLFPRKGIRAMQMGLKDQLASYVDPLLCYYCGECTDTSNLVHLDVHSMITANEIDAAQAICFNDAPRSLRELSLTGGEAGPYTIFTWRVWLEGETSADGTDLAGSNQLEYESGPYTDPATLIYYYDRIVEIGACRDTSDAMMVTVMQLPGGELTDPGFDACEKDTVLELDLNMAGMIAGHYITPWEVYLKDGVHTGIGPGSVNQDPDTMGIVMDTEGADHVSYTY